MNNKLILLCLLFIGTSSFSQEAIPKFSEARPLGFTLPEGYKKVVVPFELYNNLIVIDVLLNGSLPLKFVLDTGVRTTVLTEKTLTDILNLKYARKITIPGAGGEKLVDAFVVNNVSLNIGRIEGRGHTILVLEEDLLQLKSFLGVNVHGILGYELFSRFLVDINYNKKIITFSDPSNFKKKRSFQEIPISIEDTKPYILANFIIRGSGVVRGKFMLDTGASHTMLLDGRSSRKIFVPQPNISTTLGRGLAGNIYGEVARVDKMWINKYVFEGVIVTFPDENSYEISLDRNFRNGTFGGGMMSRFHIIFDFVNSKLYVKKGQGYHKPFEFNLSGLIVRATGVYLRNYEIDDVRKNSAAEAAGLKTGDEIITINGDPAHEFNLDQVMSLLNDKANKNIKLMILRENQSINIHFKLKRLI
jgi:predicted aspartyl protease